MKKSLLFRVFVFVGFTVLGFSVAGVDKTIVGLGICFFGGLAFFVLGEGLRDEAAGSSSKDPELHFIDKEVVVYLYDGRRVKGKIVGGISYDAPITELLLKNAHVIESDRDVGDSPTVDGMHDEVLIQVDQISVVGRDDPDRPSTSI